MKINTLIKFLPSLFSSRLAMNHKVKCKEGKEVWTSILRKQSSCNSARDDHDFIKKSKNRKKW